MQVVALTKRCWLLKGKAVLAVSLKIMSYKAIKTPLVSKLQQVCQFHRVATSLLKSGLLQLVICYNLLKQLAANLWATSFRNQSVDNLQRTCRQKAVANHANTYRYSCCKMLTDLL